MRIEDPRSNAKKFSLRNVITLNDRPYFITTGLHVVENPDWTQADHYSSEITLWSSVDGRKLDTVRTAYPIENIAADPQGRWFATLGTESGLSNEGTFILAMWSVTDDNEVKQK